MISYSLSSWLHNDNKECLPLWNIRPAISRDLLFLPSLTKLRQGNIFRSVCQEFCPGGLLASVHAGIHHPHPLGSHPAGQTPLGRHPPGRHPWADTRPQQMSTAADGTHRTGMHSCYLIYFQRCVSFKQQTCALKSCTVNAIGWVEFDMDTEIHLEGIRKYQFFANSFKN